MRRVADEHPQLVAAVLAEVRDRGPITAAQRGARARSRRAPQQGNWGWNWSLVKQGARAPVLGRGGHLSAGRTPQFERRYAVPERVLPRAVLDAPDLHRRGGVRRADPHRGPGAWRRPASSACATTSGSARPSPRAAVAHLVDAGELLPVRVDGLAPPGLPPPRRPAAAPGRGPGAAVALRPAGLGARAGARRCSASATASRSTCRRHKRVHGYYVLPFLLGDRLVARVDLKADRPAGVLRVRSALGRGPTPRAGTAAELAAELRRDGALARPGRRARRGARRPGEAAAGRRRPLRAGAGGWSVGRQPRVQVLVVALAVAVHDACRSVPPTGTRPSPPPGSRAPGWPRACASSMRTSRSRPVRRDRAARPRTVGRCSPGGQRLRRRPGASG